MTGPRSLRKLEEIRSSCKVNIVANNFEATGCTSMAEESQWKIDQDGSFFYFCSNETANGFEINFDIFPWHLIPEDMPVIGDMSSDSGTKPIPWERFSIVFIGA